MKTNRLTNFIPWLALALPLLFGLPARAQIEVAVAGQVTEVNDPNSVFNGTIAVGAPVAGRYLYYADQYTEYDSGPYERTFERDGAFQLMVGPVGLTNEVFFDIYGTMVFVVRNDDPTLGDGLSGSETMVYPSQFKPVAGSICTSSFRLDDVTGTALNSTDLLDFSLTPAGFAAFGVREGRVAVLTTTDFVNYTEVASARFSLTSFEVLSGPQAVLAPLSIQVGETAGAATVTIRRVGDLSGSATVTYDMGDLNATDGLDYTASSGTLTFAPGESRQTFTVPILDDMLSEGTESFIVNLVSATGVDLAFPYPANVNILDDEPVVPMLFLSQNAFVASKDSGSITITVVRFGEDLSGTTTADYGTLDITAQAGVDYAATTGTLTFDPGVESQSLTVPILNNPAATARVQFQVVLANINNGSPPSFAATVNILGPSPVDPTFDPGEGADGLVYDLVPLPNGRIYALGSFTNIGGYKRPFLARLHANGSTDKRFTAGQERGGFDDELSYLQPLPGGDVLAAGKFTTIGGKRQSYLARLNEEGALDKSFRPSLDAPVHRIALQPDGGILIIGEFTQVNGIPRQHIARLTSRGVLDESFDPGPGPDAPLLSIAVAPDGRILVGGFFSFFAGSPRQSVARLFANGTLDPTYSLQFNSTCTFCSTPFITRVLVRADGSHFIAGYQFFDVNGHPTGGLALINPDGTVDPGYTVGVFALNPSGTELLPDGRIVNSAQIMQAQEIGELGLFFGLARFTTNGSLDLGLDPFNFLYDWQFGLQTGLQSLAEVAVQADGKLLVSGSFDRIAGVPRKGIARIIAP